MDLSDSLRTILAAMTPIGELRLAIPLAILEMDMRWYQALPLALVGNMIPPLFLAPGLQPAYRLFQRFPGPLGKALNRLFTWRVDRLRAAWSERFTKYGPAALVILVAIPLPLTGAWTGSLAAWVFQIPPKRALPLIALGVLIAGVVVTAVTVSGTQIFGFFLANSSD